MSRAENTFATSLSLPFATSLMPYVTIPTVKGMDIYPKMVSNKFQLPKTSGPKARDMIGKVINPNNLLTTFVESLKEKF